MKTILLSLTILSVTVPAIAESKGAIVPWDSETCIRRGGIPKGDMRCFLPPLPPLPPIKR